VWRVVGAERIRNSKRGGGKLERASRARRCCRAGDCELKAGAGSVGACSQAGCSPALGGKSVKKNRGRGGGQFTEQGAAARRPAGRQGRDGLMVETWSG
jgi:hypothetical protein